ncbi:MAG TPA: GNAT family N-acetyltransferase [Myxococcales bacterium]
MRAIEPADLPAILALNNAHARELGRATEAELARFLDNASHTAAIGPRADPDAFLICFDHTTPPQGPNHAFFLARHPRFLYVDRVCVHERARRRGLGRALYEDAFAIASARSLPLVCCEVDVENAGSLAFHVAMRFTAVAEAYLPTRNKTVRYFARGT